MNIRIKNEWIGKVSEILFWDEEVSEVEELIDGSDTDDGNLEDRDPEKGVNIIFIFNIDDVLFGSAIFLELDGGFGEIVHIFGIGVGVFEVGLFKEGLWDFDGFYLLGELSLSVVLDDDAADGSVGDEGKTYFIDDTWIGEDLLSMRSSYFLKVPDLTFS